MNFPDVGTALIMLCIVCAFIGWGVIEFMIWLFSFINVSAG